MPSKLLCRLAHIPLLLLLVTAGADAATLTLPAAIAAALRTQPQICQSAHDASASRDLSRAAHAATLPQISLAAGSIWSESRARQPLFVSANGPREVIGQLRVSFPLYDPQLSALAKVARDQSVVAQWQYQATRLNVVATVVNDYYRLATLLTQERIWNSTFSTAEKLFRDTQRAYRAGAVSRLDLVQTELLRNKARTGLQQSAAEVRAAMQVMNLQMGLPRRSVSELPKVSDSIQPLPAFHALAAQAKTAQPLLQIVKRQIDVAQAQVDVQRGATLPTVRAYGAYGVDTATVPHGNDLGWQGALNLSIPIFGFGAHGQQIAAAQEQVAALRSAREALILQIRSRIAQDYGAARAARKTLANTRRAAQEAERVYVMTREGYFAGAINALNLAQAESNWVRARLELASAAVAVRLTRIQLDLDTGRYPTGPTGIPPISCP
ncbi:MAG: TolC family protein [Acidithiobacillus sp.]